MSVDWIPDSAADTLYAVLYNSDGSKLQQAKFFGKEPAAITGNSSDITSNSAKIVCSYANVPTTAEYGVKITSNTNSCSLPASIDGSSGDYTFELKELASETAYSYKAYILYKGKYYEGETRSFTTKEDENKYIPTSGRVVDLGLSVKWASCNLGAQNPEEYGEYFPFKKDMTQVCDSYLVGGLRIPTKEEIEELVTKCESVWISYKGINGLLVIGPNKNKIFLPATGDFVNGRIHYFQGRTGSYWSFTIGVNYNKIIGAYVWGFNDDRKLQLGGIDGPSDHYNPYYTIRAVCR